jgi:hypothetical protein
MKNYILLLLVLALVSCGKEDSSIEHQKSLVEYNELSGVWFRSIPINSQPLHGNSIIEKGEFHFELKFEENGEFEHRHTLLDFPENQNHPDSISVTINKGTFDFEDNLLNILNDSQVYIQIFDGEKITRDTLESRPFSQRRYQWPNVRIISNDSLKFTYHELTDLILPDQISPGILLKEEFYKRK